MALIHVDFFSAALMRTVSAKVIIPSDKYIDATTSVEFPEKYKTLYLLHGVFGNDIDWISGTRLQAFAESKNIVVVMPSGENKFYVDNETSGDRFGEYIGKELVEFTRRTFPLSDKREDTFIGGLSMGGYGALRNGLKYSDTFGRICALSAALVIERFRNADNSSPNLIDRRSFYESNWGPFDEINGSDKDYYALAEKLQEEQRPKIYMACGAQDSLSVENRQYASFLKDRGYDITYEEWTGKHDWIFWDECVSKMLDWLPLDEFKMGIGSGNTKANE